MARITVDTWEEPEHFAYRLTIVDGDEPVLCERNVFRKADATQDEVETAAYARARDHIGSTNPVVRRTVWDGERPPVSAELDWADIDLKTRVPLRIV